MVYSVLILITDAKILTNVDITNNMSTNISIKTKFNKRRCVLGYEAKENS